MLSYTPERTYIVTNVNTNVEINAILRNIIVATLKKKNSSVSYVERGSPFINKRSATSVIELLDSGH